MDLLARAADRILGRAERPTMTDRALGEIVERVLDRAATGGIPGVAFAPSGVQASVARAGHIEATAAHGADALGRAIFPGARFRIASQSKPITALLALRLVQRGAVPLDEPVWPWLKSWHPSDDQRNGYGVQRVTLRSLLAHTAGWSVHGFPSAPAARSASAPSQIDLLNGAAGEAYRVCLVHEPGTRTLYSAAGYAVADAVIEQAAGMNFEDALHAEISGPLGLESLTSARPHEGGLPIVAGHRAMGETAEDTFFLCRAASGMTSTASVLACVCSAACADALGAGRLLSQEFASEAVRAQRVDDSPHPFGLGFAIGEAGGLRTARHAGFGDGFAGVTEGVVDLGMAVSVQVTASEPTGKIVARRICARVVEVLTGRARHGGSVKAE
jgi:CubicO group peptidase (beta-lactamase class C family)